MKISIVIAAFNVEKYIHSCLYSLYIQRSNDIEIIIINDGSTDNTEIRILDFIKKFNLQDFENWKYFFQTNSGLSRTRNKGIDYASGDFILFLDGDDALDKNAISVLQDTFQRRKDIDVITYAGADFEDQELGEDQELFCSSGDLYKPSYIKNKLKDKYILGPEYLDISYRLHEFYPSSCCLLIRLNLLRNKNIYFLEGVYFEDNLFTRQLYLSANNVYVLNKPILLRRIREGSITNSEWTNYKIVSLVKVLVKLEKLEKEFYFLKAQNLDLASHVLKITTKNKIHSFTIILRMLFLKSVFRNNKNLRSFIQMFKSYIADLIV